MNVKELLVLLAFVGSAVLTPAPGFAALIVDTGPGNGANRWALQPDQWLAAEFSLGATSTITDVQGWIAGISRPGTATAAIYTDGGDVPGIELFSAAFTAAAPVDWYGPSGLSWLLLPGDYWVAYEVRAGQDLIGEMPAPSPSPLGNEAFNSFAGPYSPSDVLNLGVRISDAPAAAVPEPGSLALFAVALAAFGLTRKPKKT